MQFRKKPVVIEAWQWLGGEFKASDVCFPTFGKVHWIDETRLAVETLEGKMFASPGDWIIRGVKGEFYPCKPDIFAATYEPA